MRDDVAFELLPVSDLDPRRVVEILDLLTVSFERWPPFDPRAPHADHLRWKMSSPTAELAAVLGRSRRGGEGVAAGALVASLTIVTQRVLVGGRDVLRLRFIDQAVHPAYRGRGLSTRLNHFVADAVRHERLRLTDRGSHPAMVRLRQAQGKLPFGNPVRPLLCPLLPSILARQALSGSGLRRANSVAIPAVAALSRWRRRRRRRRPAQALSIRQLERFDARCDALWVAASTEFDVAVVRDRAHLSWRYADARGGPSILLAAEEGGDLIGWAALKTSGASGFVADLLVLPGRGDAVEALAAEAIARFEREHASRAACWLPQRHPYRRALRRAGFVDWGLSVPFAYGWEGEGAADDGLLSRRDVKLHFTIGDSDFV